MKKLTRAGLAGLLLAVSIFTACKEEKEPDFLMEETETSTSIFVENDMNRKTEISGSLSHGLNLEEDEELRYEGGEIEIPYSVTGSGVGSSVGFLVYIDGIPQPYKTDAADEYAYLHELNLQEEVEKKFSFVFTPVTGSAGEELSLCIASIIGPDFKPDMMKTFAYGHYQNTIEVICPLKFLNDAETGGMDAAEPEIGADLDVSTPEIIQAELERYTENGLTLDLDKEVITELYMDEEDMQIQESYDIREKNKVHIRYRIMGHPGVEYKTVFYIDHTPIQIDGQDAIASILEKGRVNVIDFNMDVSGQDAKTFYAVSVPCNRDDYPNDPIGINKFRSIFLYNGE